MKRIVFGLMLLMSVALAAQTSVPKELEPFQGPWALTSAGGSAVSPGMAGLIFTGDKYQGLSSGIVDERGSIRVNAATKPMSIDLVITEGESAGKTQLGVVDIDGDTMTLILAEPGDKTRPTSTSPNKLILKRVKLP